MRGAQMAPGEVESAKGPALAQPAGATVQESEWVQAAVRSAWVLEVNLGLLLYLILAPLRVLRLRSHLTLRCRLRLCQLKTVDASSC